MLRRAAALLLPLACACKPEVSFPDTDLRLTLPDGGSPTADRTLVTARAVFQQDYPGSVEDSVETPVVDGTFDLVVPIDTFSATMRLRVELDGASGVELVGGTPAYFPAESTSLRVVVGDEGTCSPLAGRKISVAREGAGAALIGTYAVVTGGIATDGPSNVVDALDQLSYANIALLPGTSPAGRTRSVPIDRIRVLVATEGAAPFVHRLYASSPDDYRSTPTLHAGADTADAVVAWDGRGALVVGGGPDGSPAQAASLVAPRGSVTTPAEDVTNIPLATAASSRAAAAHRQGVWVISHGVSSVTLEEISGDPPVSSMRIAAITDATRIAPALVVSPDGTQGLLFGGTDTGGTLRTDTVWIHGCPAACTAEPGPTWSTARSGVFVEPSGFIVGGDASTLVERITFGAAVPSIDAFASLATARRAPAVVRHPTGTLVVLGGADASGPRDDYELCFARP